jgi:hypothetical protein
MDVSVVSVVYCQVKVSAPGWSPVQRSPTECGVSECDRDRFCCGNKIAYVTNLLSCIQYVDDLENYSFGNCTGMT